MNRISAKMKEGISSALNELLRMQSLPGHVPISVCRTSTDFGCFKDFAMLACAVDLVCCEAFFTREM